MVNAIAYIVQQLGVALGIGAETVFLAVFLIMMRDDGVVDDQEKRFAKSIHHVLLTAIFFIILSGAAIIATQYLSTGSISSMLQPVVLFKWALIGVVFLFALFSRGASLVAGIFEGIAGTTWYALFLVHIIAPALTWTMFGELYGVWLAIFMVCWMILVFASRGKGQSAPAIQKAPAAVKKPIFIQTMPPQVPIQAAIVPVPAAKPSLFSRIATVAKSVPSAPPVVQQAPAMPLPIVMQAAPKIAPVMQQAPIYVAPAPAVVAPMPLVMSQPINVLKDQVAQMKIDPITLVAIKPKPTMVMQPAPVQQMPVAAPMPIQQIPVTPVIFQTPSVPAPIVAAKTSLSLQNDTPDLPAVRVMPRTPADMATQNRASVVKLEQD